MLYIYKRIEWLTQNPVHDVGKPGEAFDDFYFVCIYKDGLLHRKRLEVVLDFGIRREYACRS